MNTIANTHECLSFELLRSYCNNQLNIIEKQKVYHHLHSCELCSSAVNGFTYMPFNKFEINAIYDTVNTKINSWEKLITTIKYSSIALLSILSIGGCYFFANSFNHDKKITTVIKPEIAITQHALGFSKNEVLPDGSQEKSNITSEAKNMFMKKTLKKENKMVHIPEIMKSKTVLLAKNLIRKEEKIKINYKSNDIYIYDLKVSKYEELYVIQQNETTLFSNHLPAYKEEATSIAPDALIEHETFSSIELLKMGLYYLNKSDYENALGYFNILLINNANDINAKFYSALCYNYIGNTAKAIDLLKQLTDFKNSFYEESKWNLALSYTKTNDRKNASNLLKEIINEKGFYAEKAKMKLDEL